jgi:hypothetical protein
MVCVCVPINQLRLPPLSHQLTLYCGVPIKTSITKFVDRDSEIKFFGNYLGSLDSAVVLWIYSWFFG